mmetsp:Transcript_12756/g.38621  ORF Transcript_12756/g.38621 Transcript_12756/m.38621 type:complete len:224 (+) Transcript_12756:314-985(+)
MFTGAAVTALIDRPCVVGVGRTREQHTGVMVDESAAEAGSARRIHTVEEVDSECGTHDQIDCIAHTHQVAWLVRGEGARALVHDPPEAVLAFASAQTADRVAGQVAADQLGQALVAQRRIQSALYNAKQALSLRVVVRCQAAIDPAQSPVHGLFDARTTDCAAHNVVQCHHDISTDGILQLHRVFWCEHHFGAIVWRPKTNTFLCDTSQLEERDHLKSATIGQ